MERYTTECYLNEKDKWQKQLYSIYSIYNMTPFLFNIYTIICGERFESIYTHTPEQSVIFASLGLGSSIF